jgi:hypothetical protein
MKRRIRPILAYKIRESNQFGGRWRCNLCGMVCESKNGLGRHLSITHQTEYTWTARRVLRVMAIA